MANEKRLIAENDIYALFEENGTARLHVGHIDALPRVDAVIQMLISTIGGTHTLIGTRVSSISMSPTGCPCHNHRKENDYEQNA